MLTKKDLQIYKISSKDDSRPILECVQVKLIDGFIRLAATDSYTLEERTIPLDTDQPEGYRPDFEEMLIHREDLERIDKVMSKDHLAVINKGEVKIYKGNQFKFGMTFRPFDALFPKYDELGMTKIKEKPCKEVIVDPKLLAKMCDRASGSNGYRVHVQSALAPVVITTDRENGGTITLLVMPLKK